MRPFNWAAGVALALAGTAGADGPLDWTFGVEQRLADLEASRDRMAERLAALEKAPAAGACDGDSCPADAACPCPTCLCEEGKCTCPPGACKGCPNCGTAGKACARPAQAPAVTYQHGVPVRPGERVVAIDGVPVGGGPAMAPATAYRPVVPAYRPAYAPAYRPVYRAAPSWGGCVNGSCGRR